MREARIPILLSCWPHSALAKVVCIVVTQGDNGYEASVIEKQLRGADVNDHIRHKRLHWFDPRDL
jgi:hypothetical protein